MTSDLCPLPFQNPALSHHPAPLVLEVLEKVGLEEEDIDVLGVGPVVKRYVLGTQMRQAGLRASGWCGGATGLGM